MFIYRLLVSVLVQRLYIGYLSVFWFSVCIEDTCQCSGAVFVYRLYLLVSVLVQRLYVG